MWRISVIEFGKRPNSMLPKVLIKALHKRFRLLDKGRSLDIERNLYLWLKKTWSCTSLMVGKVPVYLCALINSLIF